ncbi:hypothetical protein P7K49_013373 [Saguinus oedipus]|uniref:IQ motif containing with AAA domain 1 n=1 Tax=Saguinus oedipus TaxID=9490 RepID=A0ABQ9VFU6_SAGOE|nr:hypothetical protein P7K49_013373 [Saguinus oedipus]
MYDKIWHQTQEALSALLDKESQKMIEPQRNQVFIFQTLATFYIKYVQIFRNLENVYDQIIHPQKRILIRKVLDGVMGRVLELKNEMVELELTEFHYFDDILQDLKLTPAYPEVSVLEGGYGESYLELEKENKVASSEDKDLCFPGQSSQAEQLDIPIPKYFLKEKLEVIKGREKILAQILADSGIDTSEMPSLGIASLSDGVKEDSKCMLRMARENCPVCLPQKTGEMHALYWPAQCCLPVCISMLDTVNSSGASFLSLLRVHTALSCTQSSHRPQHEPRAHTGLSMNPDDTGLSCTQNTGPSYTQSSHRPQLHPQLTQKYSVKSIPFDEAVKLIQIAERARQGRLRASFMKQIFLQEYRAQQSKTLDQKVMNRWAAALRIQKAWRGFHQCKNTEKLREEEMVFLGMVSFFEG